MLLTSLRPPRASTLLSLLTIITNLYGPVAAATLRVQIQPSTLLPNPNTLPASTHATLISSGSNAPLQALLRKDNTLEFPSITTTGSHLLNIYSRDFVFASYRIDIASSASTANDIETIISGAYETYPGTRWSDHGVSLLPFSTETQNPDPQPVLTVVPKILSRKNFYEERQGFNPLQLLKNPMILMAVVALAFTFGMPKLMENMDPETRQEYEEMQKKSPMNKLQQTMQGGGAGGAQGFDLAGYLASAGKK